MKEISQTIMKTPHEQNPNATATYEETINWYQQLAASHKELTMVERGETDVGKPLHLAILSSDQDTNPTSIRNKGKRILLVNNAIHPGEPCGVDASMLLIRDLLSQPKKKKMLDNVVIVFIPIYNIGGALYRNSHTRANQNGPESYGFRGNIRHLDLNRDFIKCDSRNAMAFSEIFQEWNPDVFIDNHTSNGADYQYTMTMIATQHNKLGGALGKYLDTKMMPQFYKAMAKEDWEMCPYVYAKETPDDGIMGFLDLPRYSTGYSTLFHTIGFVPEAHMLKPYKDRVAATYKFMEVNIELLNSEEGVAIQKMKQEAAEASKTQQKFEINWELDPEQPSTFLFKGFEPGYKKSEVTGLDRLYYDRSKPYEKNIPVLNNYKAKTVVNKPAAYIIPQAWKEVIARLEINKVTMQQLQKDQVLEVETYYVLSEETSSKPYEGHYIHSNVQVDRRTEKVQFYKGDYKIIMNQTRNRYIVETLEPEAPDSFFAWGFFDSILQQKEHFSAYVFEDRAAEILKENPTLMRELAKKRATDKDFAESGYEQLHFIYLNSPHYEQTHRRYPVYRLNN